MGGAAFSRFDDQLGGKTVGIHRITSMVPITQLDQAIAFYSQGLGLQVVRRRDEWGHCLAGRRTWLPDDD